MALRYRVYERKNTLQNAKRPRIACAVPTMLGRISIRELAEDIADRCTVHRADVRAVLDVLSVSSMSFMTKGFGVDLGDLGSFSFRLKSKSAPSKADFTNDLVKRVLIRYTPSAEMKARLAETSVLNVDSLLNQQTPSTGKKGQKAPDAETPSNAGTEGGTPQGGNL